MLRRASAIHEIYLFSFHYLLCWLIYLPCWKSSFLFSSPRQNKFDCNLRDLSILQDILRSYVQHRTLLRIPKHFLAPCKLAHIFSFESRFSILHTSIDVFFTVESALLCIGHSTYKNVKMADKSFSLIWDEAVPKKPTAMLSDFCFKILVKAFWITWPNESHYGLRLDIKVSFMLCGFLLKALELLF